MKPAPMSQEEAAQLLRDLHQRTADTLRALSDLGERMQRLEQAMLVRQRAERATNGRYALHESALSAVRGARNRQQTGNGDA